MVLRLLALGALAAIAVTVALVTRDLRPAMNVYLLGGAAYWLGLGGGYVTGRSGERVRKPWTGLGLVCLGTAVGLLGTRGVLPSEGYAGWLSWAGGLAAGLACVCYVMAVRTDERERGRGAATEAM
jgi:hypothetical protein